MATDASGNKIAGSDTRYLPFGEVRSGFAGSGLPTDRRFTGQIRTSYGTISMVARQYSLLLAQFISPDSIVPNAGNVRFNPLIYTDLPSPSVVPPTDNPRPA